jgi:hypothetical protein
MDPGYGFFGYPDPGPMPGDPDQVLQLKPLPVYYDFFLHGLIPCRFLHFFT